MVLVLEDLPNLRALSRECISFERFFELTYEGASADAEHLVMSSLMPLSGAVAPRLACSS